MKSQKGFTAIHLVFLLIILGVIAMGYIFYQKNEDKKYNAESYAQLENLATKFDDKMDVAQSTPRIGLGAVLNDLATIKSDISAVTVSDCLQPAKSSLSTYVGAKLAFMTDFAADKIEENDTKAYALYVIEAQEAQSKFAKDMQNCQPN